MHCTTKGMQASCVLACAIYRFARPLCINLVQPESSDPVFVMNDSYTSGLQDAVNFQVRGKRVYVVDAWT